jgi:predicted Rossmann fold flavoprotein
MGRIKVAVIGGGPAGLIAAGRAGELGCDVTLFERNKRLGRKLLLTGKGRCNITNYGTIDELIENFSETGNFLYSSLSQFSNFDLINFFKNLGLETKVERGKRVFPQSDKSSDVLNALIKYNNIHNVRFFMESRVDALLYNNKNVYGVKINKNSYEFDKVIIATGGLSYPLTGSTGDGYKLAESVGHKIIPPKPSLVPLITEEKWVSQLQGLSLRNVEIRACIESKEIYQDFGEMLFTHFGISGPLVLSMSRTIVEYLPKRVKVTIDLKPALDHKKLNERLSRDFSNEPKKQIKNYIPSLLPNKLTEPFIKLTGIPFEKRLHEISKDERQRIIDLLKALPITVIGHRSYNEAIITRGGIQRGEINPKTMESKIKGNLYFCGEVIDIDGLTGGYNLQGAFSTGYAAGNGCGKGGAI